jgi:hypothetical protein
LRELIASMPQSRRIGPRCALRRNDYDALNA